MKYATCLFSILLLVSVVYSPASAQKRTRKVKMSLSEETFFIRNVASGRELDLPGYASRAKKDNGTNVVLWDHDDGNDRKFKFQSAGGGYYYILPQHCKSRLDVEGCFKGKWFCGTYKHENGAPIQIWEFNGSSGHDVGKWRLKEVRKGQFQIFNKYSNKALDASAGGINKNGCKVQVWSSHGGSNQLWELISVKTGQRYEL